MRSGGRLHLEAHTHRAPPGAACAEFAGCCCCCCCRFGGLDYFEFEALTVVPLQTKMMDTALMTAAEVAWVDCYHRKVPPPSCPSPQQRCSSHWR